MPNFYLWKLKGWQNILLKSASKEKINIIEFRFHFLFFFPFFFFWYLGLEGGISVLQNNNTKPQVLCLCPLCGMTAVPKRDFVYDMHDQSLNMPVSINIPN